MLEQSYFRVKSLSDAVEILDIYGKEAKVLAGGTDLIINLRENIISCKHLIDIKNIPEMRIIEFSEADGLSIGGAVSLNEIINSKLVQEKYPILVSAAQTLANHQLRNRATMLGNICNASPAGDMLTPSLVLKGVIEAVSVAGVRQIVMKDFFQGVKKNALKENELAVRISFPPMNGKGKYLRLSRIKGHDLAQIGVAGFLKDDGVISFALGSVAPVPVLIEEFKLEAGKLLDEKIKAEIIDKVMSKINPIGDQRASREYRLAMAKHLTMQILETLAKEV